MYTSHVYATYRQPQPDVVMGGAYKQPEPDVVLNVDSLSQLSEEKIKKVFKSNISTGWVIITWF
jgi:hypothetical protein